MKREKYLLYTILSLCFCGTTNFTCYHIGDEFRELEISIYVLDENGHNLLDAEDGDRLLAEGFQVSYVYGGKTLETKEMNIEDDGFLYKSITKRDIPTVSMYRVKKSSDHDAYMKIDFYSYEDQHLIIKDAKFIFRWADGTEDVLSINAPFTPENFSCDITLNGKPVGFPVTIVKH